MRGVGRGAAVSSTGTRFARGGEAMAGAEQYSQAGDGSGGRERGAGRAG